MKIVIETVGEGVEVTKDFSDLEDRGEIAHFISELELIKLELLQIWQETGNPGNEDVEEEDGEE